MGLRTEVVNIIIYKNTTGMQRAFFQSVTSFQMRQKRYCRLMTIIILRIRFVFRSDKITYGKM